MSSEAADPLPISLIAHQAFRPSSKHTEIGARAVCESSTPTPPN